MRPLEYIPYFIYNSRMCCLSTLPDHSCYCVPLAIAATIIIMFTLSQRNFELPAWSLFHFLYSYPLFQLLNLHILWPLMEENIHNDLIESQRHVVL